MRRSVVLLLLAVPLAVTACGSSGGPDRDLADVSPAPTSTGSGAPGSVPLPGGDAVLITVDAADGSEPTVHTLACPGSGPAVPGSTLPDGDAACRHLRSTTEPFAQVPADAVCSQQFGGPQTAVITGTWAGAAVRLELSRTDGCRIAQWDRLAPLLPVDVG
jgi:subtilisin inhibitor-like